MGYVGINWCDVSVSVVMLTAGAPNVVDEDQYLELVPSANGDTVVSFGSTQIDPTLYWLMEVANGDPTATKTINFIGGIPAQTPPQIILPSGYSHISLAPGFTQRFAFVPNIGWVALFPGTLVV